MLSELLPEDKRRLHELELQVAEIERGNPHIQIPDIYLGLTEMETRLAHLDKLAQKESKSHREDFMRRVQHLKSSHAHIKTSLDNLSRRVGYRSFQDDRNRLFAGAATIDVEDGSTTETLVKENSSLDSSRSMIQSYIAVGRDTLEEMVSQRNRLKNVQRKVLDIVNYLGLSNSMMKGVEQRDVVDRYIVIGGMLIILCLLFFIYFFLWRK